MPGEDAEEKETEKKVVALDEGDIALLKTYGRGPYSRSIKSLETDIKAVETRVKTLIGVKESETGLSPPSQWDLVQDKQMMQEEEPLHVARCTKIINGGQEDAMYMITVPQIAKFVVELDERVAPPDIEESMRVGCDRAKFQIKLPLPPKIDPSVTMMTVEEKPDGASSRNRRAKRSGRRATRGSSALKARSPAPLTPLLLLLLLLLLLPRARSAQ